MTTLSSVWYQSWRIVGGGGGACACASAGDDDDDVDAADDVAAAASSDADGGVEGKFEDMSDDDIMRP